MTSYAYRRLQGPVEGLGGVLYLTLRVGVIDRYVRHQDAAGNELLLKQSPKRRGYLAIRSLAYNQRAARIPGYFNISA